MQRNQLNHPNTEKNDKVNSNFRLIEVDHSVDDNDGHSSSSSISLNEEKYHQRDKFSYSAALAENGGTIPNDSRIRPINVDNQHEEDKREEGPKISDKSVLTF